MMKRILFGIKVAVLTAFISEGFCTELSVTQSLNLNIPQDIQKSTYTITNKETSPEIRLYAENIEQKIHTNLINLKLSTQTKSARPYGMFDVQVTLQGDGTIDDLQILPTEDSVIVGDYNAFMNLLSIAIKGDKLYPSFPPATFTGYELVRLETSVEISEPNVNLKTGRKSKARNAH